MISSKSYNYILFLSHIRLNRSDNSLAKSFAVINNLVLSITLKRRFFPYFEKIVKTRPPSARFLIVYIKIVFH